ncbi:MAG: oligoendopeptidase F, partial [Ktedonobacterales bacterium]|nr:oligoendopeptidase F [Ktedonobacterales bacterium]
TWNAESVFPTTEAWQAAAEQAGKDIPTIARFQGHLGESAATLLEALRAQEALMQQIGKIYVYAHFAANVDANDQAAAGMVGQGGALFGGFLATAAYIEPEILTIGREKLDEWMGQNADLALYRHTFDNLFRKQAHVRSAEVEALLGMATEAFANYTNNENVLTSADMTFRRATTAEGSDTDVFQGNWETLLASPNREQRRTTWESYQDGYLALQNTFASNLTGAVKRDVFFARARNYPSSLEAALFENNIPVEVFRNTIETYQRNLPIWHRYWGVLKRVLGVDQIRSYDVHAPLATNAPAIPYEQSIEWISAGLAPLGDDYVAALRQGTLKDRWVDRAVNQGKTAGAFSSGFPGTFPFILMSYDDTIYNMGTLAHELGHSMHSYSTWRNQPLAYSDYSLFVAEVASNFHQAMVRAHLFEANPEPNFQLAVIDEAMRNFHRYFFVMPTLARFELEMHERAERGQSTSAEVLNNLMADLLTEAYGPDVAVDRERDGITWAQFGHLYANFYVFQYTTGIAAANMLAQKVRSEGPAAAQQYRQFLNAGSSLYPIEALKLAGVDMASPEPVERTYQILSGLVDRLESFTGK